jgi:hypothetical protein
VQAEREELALMLATVNSVRVAAARRDVETAGVMTHEHVVHLNQKKVYPADREDNMWVLDTGASNHMTGCREVLASLDMSVGGTVCFGDGSLVEIKGLGSVMLQTKNKGHKVLTSVYFTPKLKSNIISLGQLEEGAAKLSLRMVA